MNIVLVHIGSKVPEYFWICVSQIRKFFNGPVYFYGESLHHEAAKYHNVIQMSFPCPRVKDFEKVSFLGNYGKFWDYTFRRMFVIEDLMRSTGISNVIHIENDVMIYADPRTLGFSGSARLVSACDIGPKYATYAYTHIPNLDAIRKLNDAHLRVLREGKRVLDLRYGEGMVNEMLIAKDLMNRGELAALPPLEFDGASAGQYLFGTQTDPPGWTGEHHHLGRMIRAGEASVSFEDNRPFITAAGKRHRLNNLHIHSKRLELAQ